MDAHDDSVLLPLDPDATSPEIPAARLRELRVILEDGACASATHDDPAPPPSVTSRKPADESGRYAVVSAYRPLSARRRH